MSAIALPIDTLQALRQRRAAGERISTLAAEVGVPWQKLDKALRHTVTTVSEAAEPHSSEAPHKFPIVPAGKAGPLTERYRPRRLEAVLGQPHVVKLLRRFAASPRPMAFLFEGDTGTGKSSAALALAAELGCSVDQAEFGGVWTIPSGDQTADAVRATCSHMWMTPMFGSGWRVFIVNEADRISRAAELLWLDQLENLPQRNVVIFTTNDAGNLSCRFCDRCVRLKFVADPQKLDVDARRLVASIWRQEAKKAPTAVQVDAILAAGVDDGKLSFRRIVQVIQVQLMEAGVL